MRSALAASKLTCYVFFLQGITYSYYDTKFSKQDFNSLGYPVGQFHTELSYRTWSLTYLLMVVVLLLFVMIVNPQWGLIFVAAIAAAAAAVEDLCSFIFLSFISGSHIIC